MLEEACALQLGLVLWLFLGYSLAFGKERESSAKQCLVKVFFISWTNLISFYDQVTCIVDEGKAANVMY